MAARMLSTQSSSGRRVYDPAMQTIAGYTIMGAPQEVRFALYDKDGSLVEEIAHDGGTFAEPVDVQAGQMVAMLTPVDQRLTLVHVAPT